VAREGKTITWHELGYWDGDGVWHAVAGYVNNATARGDIENAQQWFPNVTLCVRTQERSLITE
jgi:hypothetical protein